MKHFSAKSITSAASVVPFDLEEGLKLKKEGIGRVSKRNAKFMREAVAHVRTMLGFVGRFEEIRHDLIARGIKPRKWQAWGALSTKLIGLGIIAPTGDTAKMRDPRSHGHDTNIYAVVA